MLARGFTLLELVVTMLIAAILLAIGIPSFRAMIANSRLAAQANTFVAALNYARSEAIRRSMPVTICRSANPNAVPPACTDGGWETGWIVFEESAGNDGTFTTSAAELAAGTRLDASPIRSSATGNPVLRRGALLDAAVTPLDDQLLMAGEALDGDATLRASRSAITFSEQGMATSQMTTFSLCDHLDPTRSRRVIVNFVGRIRVAEGGGACPPAP